MRAVVIFASLFFLFGTYATVASGADRTPRRTTGSHAAVPRISPTRTFYKYQSMVYRATSLQQLKPYVSSKTRRFWKEFETDEREELESFKRRLIYDARVTSERIDGNTAKVTVTGRERKGSVRGRPARGDFQMVNEGGYWRIHQWRISFGNLVAPVPY